GGVGRGPARRHRSPAKESGDRESERSNPLALLDVLEPPGGVAEAGWRVDLPERERPVEAERHTIGDEPARSEPRRPDEAVAEREPVRSVEQLVRRRVSGEIEDHAPASDQERAEAVPGAVAREAELEARIERREHHLGFADHTIAFHAAGMHDVPRAVDQGDHAFERHGPRELDAPPAAVRQATL